MLELAQAAFDEDVGADGFGLKVEDLEGGGKVAAVGTETGPGAAPLARIFGATKIITRSASPSAKSEAKTPGPPSTMTRDMPR